MKIKVKVHSNSSKQKIEEISSLFYEVWVKEKPINGKVNNVLEKLLSKYLDKRYRLISGFGSRIKFFECG